MLLLTRQLVTYGRRISIITLNYYSMNISRVDVLLLFLYFWSLLFHGLNVCYYYYLTLFRFPAGVYCITTGGVR